MNSLIQSIWYRSCWLRRGNPRCWQHSRTSMTAQVGTVVPELHAHVHNPCVGWHCMLYTPLPVPLLSAVLLCSICADASKQQLPALSVMAMDSHPVTSSCCPDHADGHSHEYAHQHEHSTSSSENIGAGSSEAEAELSLEQASQLVRYNAFGDAFEDLAAAALRGARMPHSHVGCWPAFSLFNHSCVPNTVHYVVGQNMVVRATEDVPAGWSMCGSSKGCCRQLVAAWVASVWHAMLRAGMLLIRCANSF